MNAAKTNDEDYSPLRITPDFKENPFMEIVRNVESNITTGTANHDEILDRLLEQIQPIDFVSLAGVDDKSKLNNRLYRILIIEQLISVANNNGWGVCYCEGSVYVFNGAFWKAVDDDQFKQFLGEVAIKMGLFWGESKDFLFRKQLLEQFVSGALHVKRQKENSVAINLKNGTLEVCNGKHLLVLLISAIS